jgi:hypothetical protein
VSDPEKKSSNLGWEAILTHPVTVGVAIWLFIPVGIVLLLMNPTLRKDRRWWAGAAAWGLYLLWVGRLPLVRFRNDSDVATMDDSNENNTKRSSWSSSRTEATEDQATADKSFVALLAEADSLWKDKDSRPDALEKYVLLLDTYCGYGKGSPNSEVGRAHQADLGRVAVRAIDALVESGNTTSAKKLIIAADQQNLTLVFRNPKSDALVPKAKAERAQEERELDRELEQMRRRNEAEPSADSDDVSGTRPSRPSQSDRQPIAASRIPRTVSRSPSAAVGHEARLESLLSRVRPGMSYSQVVGILGSPDDTSTEDLGELGSFTKGRILTIAKWESPDDEGSAILLSFENDVLSEGGTEGFKVGKGFRWAAPPGSSAADRRELQDAVRGLGITLDE